MIAISPIIGGLPISGPTARLMNAKKLEVSSLQIAKLYQDICSTFIIDETEKDSVSKIERETGLEVLVENILFKTPVIASKLARTILDRGKSL